MTQAKLLAATFALAILAGCGGTGYSTASNVSPVAHSNTPGYYPETGGSN